MRKGIRGLIITTMCFFIPAMTFAQSITLSWSPSPEHDIKYYAIHKSNSSLPTEIVARKSPDELTFVDRDITVGETYYYRITAVDSAGNTSGYSQEVVIPTVAMNAGVPDEFALSPNYPNPFNPETEFNYSVPENGPVSLIIYDVLGRKIKTLFQGNHQPGTYKIKWNGTNDALQKVASGMYIARFVAGSFVQVRKLLLQK